MEPEETRDINCWIRIQKDPYNCTETIFYVGSKLKLILFFQASHYNSPMYLYCFPIFEFAEKVKFYEIGCTLYNNIAYESICVLSLGYRGCKTLEYKEIKILPKTTSSIRVTL